MMKKIAIGQVRPGDILGEDVIDPRSRSILLRRGAELSLAALDRLRSRHIPELVIHEQTAEKETEFSSAQETLLDLAGLPEGEAGLLSLLELPVFQQLDAMVETAPAQLEEQASELPLASAVTEHQQVERTTLFQRKLLSHHGDGVELVAELMRSSREARIPPSRESEKLVTGLIEDYLHNPAMVNQLASRSHAENGHLHHHSVNTSLYALFVARQLSFGFEQATALMQSCLCHDLGMMRIPEHILYKEGPLNADERWEVYKHPLLSFDVCSKMRTMPGHLPLTVYQHHEHTDGSGYPKGRRGRLIHTFARIIAVCTTYAAMTSPRPYRAPMSRSQAMEEIIRMAGAGLLDRSIVRALLQELSLFPVGSWVMLSNGRIARVVAAHPRRYTRPQVAVFLDAAGQKLPQPELLDLVLYDGLTIERTVPEEQALRTLGLRDALFAAL